MSLSSGGIRLYSEYARTLLGDRRMTSGEMATTHGSRSSPTRRCGSWSGTGWQACPTAVSQPSPAGRSERSKRRSLPNDNCSRCPEPDPIDGAAQIGTAPAVRHFDPGSSSSFSHPSPDEQRRRVVLVGWRSPTVRPMTPQSPPRSPTGLRDRGNLQLLFRRAVHEGELDPSSTRELARLILSLAAGLAGQLLYDDVPEKHVRALVDMAIRALLTPALTQAPSANHRGEEGWPK